MSGREPTPAWLEWVEPGVADLSDEQLAEYIGYWRQRGEEYRRRRRRVSRQHPDAFRWGYSAWWCSKYESMGMRETERRRVRREEGER